MFRLIGFFLAFFSFQLPLFSQKDSLSLDSCLIWTRMNYPAIKQLDLMRRTEVKAISNANKTLLPQININAQASYQSDITGLTLNLPGVVLPELPSKDQYKIYSDINQIVYGGGSIALQKKIIQNNSTIEILKVESELYKLNERIIQLYFSGLLIQQQQELVSIIISDLDEQIKKAEAALESKVISPGSLYQLQSERIKNQQRWIELSSLFKQTLKILSEFIHMKLRDNTKLIIPQQLNLKTDISRFELKMWDEQINLFESQWKINRSRFIPKVSLYAQLGYANPALNFLKNEFKTYYIAGIRINWNFTSIYNLKNDHQISLLNKDMATLQKETFWFNTQLNLIQQNEEIDKFKTLLISDAENLDLRIKIMEIAKVQWENGILSVSDYIRELNAVDLSKTNQLIHRIQLLQSQYLHNFNAGN